MAGVRTAVVLTHGMHESCKSQDWERFRQHTFMHIQTMLHKLKTSKSKFVLVYKEHDATHFPTVSGLYNGSALPGLADSSNGSALSGRSNGSAVYRSGQSWLCRPVRREDPLPPMRALELSSGLPALKDLQVPNLLISSFDDDLRDGAGLHATFAKVPSKSLPVDCLHWMLPGIPDIWTERMLAALAVLARDVRTALPRL